jgi:hypothetical protein
MNWKQTIGLVISVGAIIALCFLVVFPALYSKDEPQENEVASETDVRSKDEERSVLPKLKGVNWEAAPEAAKKTAEKKPSEKPQEEPSRVAKLMDTKKLPKPAPEKKAPAPLLELQEMLWYEQEGFVVVTGTVKNISSRSLPTVQAHVTFEGSDKWYISEEYAMIDLNPIFPNQVSTFTVVSRYYPEITNAVIDFRKFSGESFPWRKSEAFQEAVEKDDNEAGDIPVGEEVVAPEEETAQP